MFPAGKKIEDLDVRPNAPAFYCFKYSTNNEKKSKTGAKDTACSLSAMLADFPEANPKILTLTLTLKPDP